MKQNLKISIIMNCLNGEKYLSQAITSVLNQSYENWELIFWDNKSDDKSEKIFKKFKDSRLKYFFSTNQTSVHKARNLALSKSTGDLITFIDTDDYWLKDKLYLQVDELNNHIDASCVYSKYFIKYQGTLFPNRLITQDQLPTGFIFKKILINYNIAFLSILFKKKNLNNFPNIFRTDFDLISDFDLITKFSKNNKIVCVQKPLFVYRKHGSSMSRINYYKQVEQMEKWLEEEKIDNFFSEDDLSKISKHVYNMTYKLEIQKSNFFNFFKILFSNLSKGKKLNTCIYFFLKDF